MRDSSIQKAPKFYKFSILKSESLNYLSNNFMNYINLKHKNFSEGIISGINITYDMKKNIFKIGGGLLKIKNKIYFTEEVDIKVPEDEGRYTLVLEIKNYDDNENGYIVSEHLFKFKDTSQIIENEFEIFSIILRKGAKIFNTKDNFNEFNEKYNIIDITNQKYSIKNSNNYGINPLILKKWANKMIKFKLKNIDINIVLLSLNSNISRESLIAYINYRLNLNIVNLNNKEIIFYLSKILKDITKNIEIGNKNDEENYTKFTVD